MNDEGPSASETPTGIRVVVIADVRLYRDGLAGHLSRHEEFVFVGSAANGEEALALIGAARPDVAVLDMATRNSLEIVRAVRAAVPAVKFVAFGVTDADRGILACAEAGISGYVTVDQSTDDLTAMITSVARDELRCSPRLAATLFRRLAHLAARGRSQATTLAELTRRESEIGRLIERGLSNKEIAASLQIEVATVKNHVHNILEKLEVGTRGAAAARLRGASGGGGGSAGSRRSLGSRISGEFTI